MGEPIQLSVHIVTWRRLSDLQRCVNSVLTALPERSEVHVVVNGDDNISEAWLASVPHSALRIHTGPKLTLAKARNAIFDLCRGEVIYCLDDDVAVPPTLFDDALALFEADPKLAVLGGPNLTPPQSPFIEQLFGAILTSAVAAPRVRARYGGIRNRGDFEATEYDLIFCNLALRPSAIPPAMRFREHLVSNEESLFVAEGARAGLRMAFSPRLFVYHRRRAGLKGFTKQIASYGRGRAQQTLYLPTVAAWPFLLPSLLWTLPLWLVAVPQLREAALFLASFYLGVSYLAAGSSPELRRLGWRSLICAGPLTLLIHFAYGFGFLRGIFYGDASSVLPAPDPAPAQSEGYLIPRGT